MKLSNYLLAIALPGLLGGCSVFSHSSTAEADSSSMFAFSQTANVYSAGEQVNRSFKVISVVTGDSCQNSRSDPPASAAVARQRMLLNARQFNADGVVASQCFALPVKDNPYCYSKVTCSGHAVQWQQ
ncbi:hypothetical protein CWI84_05540 [Idiomarina tyrosinivorans]|uniref:RcsF protein n=1 Tax=Idiomarina tyrosinivorans TaxID=1445662 RepID=A0A432ZRQ8_9GAMM|nr:Rcs stress response system protein RcsF [Idiomarina tyrosinivorans]RUO80521.1 hypothetical protein CWI84_05540 [Idiomarina tyrosinivorans]